MRILVWGERVFDTPTLWVEVSDFKTFGVLYCGVWDAWLYTIYCFTCTMCVVNYLLLRGVGQRLHGCYYTNEK